MKDLKYYKDNCEEDYLHTPISVLRYITELEKITETKPLIIDSVVSSVKNKEAIISKMKTMTDDERLDIITEFCKYCGDLDSGCQCWNDE
tara:strand:- start:84 stop:353 length:270 start_codon:yes stop_codon:yes gene_type:complete